MPDCSRAAERGSADRGRIAASGESLAPDARSHCPNHRADTNCCCHGFPTASANCSGAIRTFLPLSCVRRGPRSPAGSGESVLRGGCVRWPQGDSAGRAASGNLLQDRSVLAALRSQRQTGWSNHRTLRFCNRPQRLGGPYGSPRAHPSDPESGARHVSPASRT